MIADKEVVRLFLTGYAKRNGIAFVSTVHPDEHVRHLPAVDAIATDEAGVTIAVEHTILEPFPGQKESLHERLARVFEPLKSRNVPGRNIMLTVADDSVKRGQNWAPIVAAVGGWFENVRRSLPFGWSYHIIPIDPEVHIVVQCEPINGDYGVVSILYWRPRMDLEFVDAVTRSVERKVHKLVNASARRRVLILQREWAAYSIQRLETVIGSLVPQFPDIRRVDEIWLADSWFFDRYGFVRFHGIWPAPRVSSASFRSP